MVRVNRATHDEIDAAVRALRNGELVAFPTETVYGLGANAADPAAVRKIFEAKGRPETHPVIVHLDSPRYLHRWVREVPEAAQRLAERFWPGPLTLVMPKAASVHDIVTGGQATVAIRVPAHPMAQQLLTAFGGGIAAPSANRYGRVSPTRAEHVREEFGDAVKVILDGGACQIGLESTIVACDGETTRLLRPGAITLSQLRSVVPVALAEAGEVAPRVPGTPPAHYAPRTPLFVVRPDELDARVAALASGGQRVAVLAHRVPSHTYRSVTWINGGSRPDIYAHDLYAHLRTLDRTGCSQILVQDVPDVERWAAVRDRLTRAAAAGTQPDASAAGTDVSILP
jgi:L-threonylcarbamoyladenylate synthase